MWPSSIRKLPCPICRLIVLWCWPIASTRPVRPQSFPTTAFYVTAPLLLPSLRRGLTLAAATCVGEFAATLFLSRPEWQTLTTLIYRYLGTAGSDNHGRAMVLTAVLMLLALMVFLLLDSAEQAEKKRQAV